MSSVGKLFPKRQPSPNARPRADVRFLGLRVEPWPDGRRVKILIDLTPFQELPNLEITILDAHSNEAAHTAIIENADEKLVFTMHLRGGQPESEEFLLHATLGYPDLPDVDRAEIRFSLAQP